MQTGTLAIGLLLALALPRQIDDDADPLLNPQANVARDPPASYSDVLFQKMGEPQPGDWMAAHPEPAQSFADYVRSGPNRPRRVRHWIVLQPLGTMTAETRNRMEMFRAFLAAYYALPVRTEGWIPMANVKSRERDLYGRTFRQYLTGDILRNMLLPRVKVGTFCMLGVTMDDLYPEESWNYVFGQAWLAHRTGVFSLVRFYPEFWGDERTEASERLAGKRSLQTLVHEVGHMFGVHHCQTYQCVMNGCNSLRESDARPIHLCPKCLKKFRWNIGFDVAARYETLKAFYEAHDMKAEAAWIEKRLRECRGTADGDKNPAEPSTDKGPSLVPNSAAGGP